MILSACRPSPTDGARAQIESRLASWFRPDFEVVGQSAAVRPIIRQSRLVMGLHPAHPQIGFFNGLGSKGALNAPYFAGQFANFLCGLGEIDEEVDLRRNF